MLPPHDRTVSETELRLLLTAAGSGLWRAKGIGDLRGDGWARAPAWCSTLPDAWSLKLRP